ncbi:MAG: DHH family phosphoesterase [Betaproteobacteria bacterium]|nr:DHH family phosphoesterase [Betaproteobacteria bacterium]
MLEPAAEVKLRDVDQDLLRSLMDQKVPGLAARVLAGRGISEAKKMFGGGNSKIAGISGGGAAKAAARIAEAVSNNKRICFVTDFDADGVCAATIIGAFMRQLEAKYCIRFCRRGEVRGLDPEMVRTIDADCASVIVTADNGISSVTAAEEAKRRGIELIITDHHKPGDVIPQAAAIANPMLPDSGLPAPKICGAVVILLVMREAFRSIDARIKPPNLLDIAAIATIADMMPMSEDFNRQIVASGISLIRSGHCQVGLKAIIGESKCRDFSSRDISFRVAPIINAAGRLGKAERAFACLEADNFSKACELARELEGYNRERRNLTKKMVKEAIAQIDNLGLPFNFAYSPEWPEGLFGLVANKLLSGTGKPSIVLGKAGSTLRGSMRSIESISAHEILASIKRRKPDLLGDFGGHAGAAGFALKGNMDDLKKELILEFATLLRDPPPAAPIYADANPDFDELCDGSSEYLAALPWGRNFPEPLFLGNFTIERVNGAASGNGYNHRLDLNGRQVVAWYRQEIGKPGEDLQILYRTASSRRKGSPPLLFIDSIHKNENP